MMIFLRRVKLADVVTVQCAHDADPREHRRTTEISQSGAQAGVPVGNLIRLASEAESRNASVL
jgi:hypothetical protein